MAKQLKLWNGRDSNVRNPYDPRWQSIPTNASVSIYAAAYSRADLRRLIGEYSRNEPSLKELATYWTDCWGLSMEGIEPVRGIWLKVGWGDDKPVRIF